MITISTLLIVLCHMQTSIDYLLMSFMLIIILFMMQTVIIDWPSHFYLSKNILF